MSINRFLHWIPSLVMMLVIFLASSTPSTSIPYFGAADMVVKKGGHVLGYALLGTTFWYGLGFEKKQLWLAWFLAVLYASSDEFHQSFTFGRHPSWVDVLLFDGGGALMALLLTTWWWDRRTAKKR